MNYVNLKVKFLNPFFFLSFFYIFFFFFSWGCIKMSKTLSAKYYQKKKQRLQKKACKRYQNLSKE